MNKPFDFLGQERAAAERVIKRADIAERFEAIKARDLGRKKRKQERMQKLTNKVNHEQSI